MNFALPEWIERLLGLEAAAGRPTAWSLEWRWPWPPWATLLFVLFAVGFVAMIYRREARRASRAYRLALASMRLSLILLAMAMAAQVALRPLRTDLPELVLLVDDSRSMTLDDKPGTSRWKLLQTLLTENDEELLRKLREKYVLRLLFLGDRRTEREDNLAETIAAIRAATPDGRQSRLGEAVIAAVDLRTDSPPTAMLFFSDGVNTAGPSLAEAAEHARRRGVPLWFVGLGDERPPRELRISDLIAEETVFFGDALLVQFRLQTQGLKGKQISIVLREIGIDAPPVETKLTAAQDGRSQIIGLPFRPARPGRVEYAVEAVAVGEAEVKSNPLAGAVDVRREKIAVLLAESAPSFEFRYLHNLLSRREDVELSSVLQEADPGHADQAGGFLSEVPQTRDALFAFDVVILGDVNPRLLSPDVLRNLAEFVERPEKGGGVALIAGPRYMPSAFAQTPLARLLPSAAREQRPIVAENNTAGFRVMPTELGFVSPGMQLGATAEETRAIWNALPPLYWRLDLSPDKLSPAVKVLAVAEQRESDGNRAPLICAQYIGAGRVLFHATDETWRWRRGVGDEYFARYWLQSIHWLGRAKLVGEATLRTDRESYFAGETVRLQVRFRDERQAPAEDDGAAAMLEPADGRPERVQLRRVGGGRGLFEAAVDGLRPGKYRVRLVLPRLADGPPSAEFLVQPPVDELARQQADFAAMKEAAELSGGRFCGAADAGRLLAELPPGQPAVVERLPPRPLWNRWPLVLAFLALLIGEWMLRKRRQMA